MTTRNKEDVLREAKYLLSLNEAAKGGPYGGFAAEKFVAVMKELVQLLNSAVTPYLCEMCGNQDANLAPHTEKILCECCSTFLLIGLHECLSHQPAGSNRP